MGAGGGRGEGILFLSSATCKALFRASSDQGGDARRERAKKRRPVALGEQECGRGPRHPNWVSRATLSENHAPRAEARL